MAGRIAIVGRGTCAFVVKVKNVQDAGAIAAIVVNDVSGPPPGMGGTDPTIVIPAVMVSPEDAQSFDSNLVNVWNVGLTDLTPPVITGPSTVVVNATSPTGAVPDYTGVFSITDDLDPQPRLFCDRFVGSELPIGDTAVRCYARDNVGNASPSFTNFTVHVKGAGEQISGLPLTSGH